MVEGFERLTRHRRQLLAFPDDGRVFVNIANALRLTDQLSDGLSWARWSVRDELWPATGVAPTAFQGLGNLLLDLGRFEEADRAYALADPGQTNARIQFNRSRVMQGLGRWRESWSLAESRWMDGGEALEGSPPRPHWSGWPDVDRLVLWDEQGFGDTLQALRWLPRLMQQGCQVELQVRPALQRLLQQGLAWLGPRLRVSERPRATSEPAQTMCHGSLLSLPARLNVDGMPPGGVLRLPEQPSAPSTRPTLGLVWEAGRYLDDPGKALEYRRKTLPEQHRLRLCSALRARGVDLVLLQPGSDLPATADFLEQAQWMRRCDLLLSVDTAAAHLGGALHHPIWLMLPWACATRWQRAVSTTPLYGSMRLLRQPSHGDWPGLVAGVLKAVDQWLSADDWRRNRSNNVS